MARTIWLAFAIFCVGVSQLHAAPTIDKILNLIADELLDSSSEYKGSPHYHHDHHHTNYVPVYQPAPNPGPNPDYHPYPAEQHYYPQNRPSSGSYYGNNYYQDGNQLGYYDNYQQHQQNPQSGYGHYPQVQNTGYRYKEPERYGYGPSY